MLVHQIEMTQQNQKATFDAQIASAKASEEGKQQTETVKGDIDIEKVKIQEESAVKVSLSAMFTSLLKDGNQIPASMQPVFNAWVENTMIPMVTQNEQQKAAIIQQYQQSQQPMNEEQGEQMPENEMMEQEQPQQQMQQDNSQPQEVAA
jgi:hypothetical protein